MVKDSPDPRWPGHIELPAYLTFPMLFLWETAMNEAKKVTVASKGVDAVTTSDFYLKLLPTATGLVREWHITGLPEKVDENNFPASIKLMSWMIECITDLYKQTNDVSPNS